MTASELAFGTFIGNLTSARRLANGDLLASIRIAYKYKGRNLQETLSVYFRTGFEYGKIEIDEGGTTIVSDNLHLTFSPSYQSYSLDSNEFLVITGISKEQKSYEVTLVPV